MNTLAIKSNKLNMILSIAIPSIISMLLTTLITITDGYFTDPSPLNFTVSGLPCRGLIHDTVV